MTDEAAENTLAAGGATGMVARRSRRREAVTAVEDAERRARERWPHGDPAERLDHVERPREFARLLLERRTAAC